MASTRLVTRDQEHRPSYPWWAWVLAIASALGGGTLFFGWVLSL